MTSLAEHLLYAVEDAQGDLYALATGQAAATAAVAQAMDYLDGAASCGHPRAAGWVAARLPIAMRAVTPAERDDLLEEHGTPVLAREP